LAEFPESGLTYGTTAIPAGNWEKQNRLLNRLLFYTISSAEFGADPTGTSFSRTAIQNCWTAAPPYSTIWYPPSTSGQATYLIDAALVHPAKPLFHHCPRGGAVIKNTGTGNVFESNGADNWTIDGLTLDGNYPTRTSGRGLQCNNSTDWRVTNFRLQNVPEMGAVMAAGCARWSLDHFTVENTKNAGIWLGEGTGNTEDFTIAHGRLTATNVANAVGHAGIQSLGAGGVAATSVIRRGEFLDVHVYDYTRVGFGLDFITDSTLTDCQARGEHTGEALALTGARNKVRGGRYGESTGAAGLLLYCWVGNDQDGRDTEIDGVYLPGPVSPVHQGLAIVPAENNVTFRDIDIHGIRAKGWNYGVQNYNTPGPKTGITMSASVVVHDSNLRDNATGQTLFASSGATLRDNVP
jgi:hypothetical protein